MKKKLFSVLLVGLFTIGIAVFATDTPCADGYAACRDGGGTLEACNAGFWACMDVMY